MKILLDLIPFQVQDGIGGAASFTKRVIDEIILHKTDIISLYGLYDSKLPKAKLYDIDMLSNENNISLFDISQNNISSYIENNNIDIFFIAIGQFYSHYNLTGIKCKTVMFIHDIFDIERCDNYIDTILFDNNTESYWVQAKRYINLLSGRWKKQAEQCYGNIIPLYTAANTIPYTVSEYTKNSLEYYFPQLKDKIKICYSPLKNNIRKQYIENNDLRALIKGKKQYIIMLAANRRYKNPKNVIKVFKRLHETHPDLYLLTLKYGKSINKNHIDICFLSDSDLEYAYKHAYALVFASFFEGFGYPPIEAIKYGTPVIAANVTSIPEILGDAGIYFSPFYPADLYRVIKIVLNNREINKIKIEKRMKEIELRQNKDLELLTKELTNIKVY